MAIDVFTISAIADELRANVLGGRLQAVIDVDALGIGFELYARGKRHYLYLSAEPAQPRAHLSPGKLRRALPKPTQLGLLCRKYLPGAALVAISQPAWERALELQFESADGSFRLIAELIPRRANVLLLQDGQILDCIKRVGPEENRYRLSLPNHKYVPPPPARDQAHPAALSAADLAAMLDSAQKPSMQTRRLLPAKILGIGPLMAKEIVFRATGDSAARIENTAVDALHAAMRALVMPLLDRRWQPGIGSLGGLPVAYSVFPLSHLQWQARPTASAAVSEFYAVLQGDDAYHKAKQPTAAALDGAEARLNAKLASLQAGLKDDSALEKIKQSGELILAYQYAISAGQTELSAYYDADAAELRIPLDAARSPLENAQAYFRRYEKAKSARAALPALIAETELELRYIAQLRADLALARNWLEIDDVLQALQARGHWRGPRQKRLGGGERSGPLRVVSRDGYVIWVGRNSRQNEIVTFKKANGQDIWLHARDAPGAHVVIRNDGRRIPESLIAEAAAVAAWYSSLRAETRAQVDYTRVKYVRAVKGGGAGMVTFRNEKSIFVAPRAEAILS